MNVLKRWPLVWRSTMTEAVAKAIKYLAGQNTELTTQLDRLRVFNKAFAQENADLQHRMESLAYQLKACHDSKLKSDQVIRHQEHAMDDLRRHITGLQADPEKARKQADQVRGKPWT